MTTSGSYTFNPSLGELVLYAYNSIGIRNTSLLQEHMMTARMATNMMLSRWSNQGVNLWRVDLVTVPLVEGQSVYAVSPSTVVILDAYVTIDNGTGSPIDRIILPVSRTEYASFPNKEQQGFTTTFWFDRLTSGTDMIGPGSSQSPVVTGPQVTLWPVPDGSSAQYLKYYRVVQAQTADYSNAQTVDIPFLWMEAFADGLAFRLAKVWNPQIAPALKAMADESYQIAADQNIETAQQYISPQLSGYFRP
jgi:hypothetical protein